MSEPVPTSIDTESFNITVVGAFNANILRPKWLAQQGIIKGPDVLTLLSDSTAHPINLVQDNPVWGWFVRPDRLLAFGQAKGCSSFVDSVLRVLEHTPVRAAGINVRFKCHYTDLPETLQRLRSSGDEVAAAQKLLGGESLDKRAAVLKVKRPGGELVSITLSWLADDEVALAYNNHLDSTVVETLRKHAKLAEEFEREVHDMLGAKNEH